MNQLFDKKKWRIDSNYGCIDTYLNKDKVKIQFWKEDNNGVYDTEYTYSISTSKGQIKGTKSYFISEGTRFSHILELIDRIHSEIRVKELRESLNRGSKTQQLRQIQRDRRRLYGR